MGQFGRTALGVVRANVHAKTSRAVPKEVEVELVPKGPGNRLYHLYIRRPLPLFRGESINSFHPILERGRVEERLLVVLE